MLTTRKWVRFYAPAVGAAVVLPASATVDDTSGDGNGGGQCCWTPGFVKVTVQ
jgi:hypothetical protein